MEKGNIWLADIWSQKEKKNSERKEGKYLEKENFWSVEDKKNRLQADGRKEHRRLYKRLEMISIESRT